MSRNDFPRRRLFQPEPYGEHEADDLFQVTFPGRWRARSASRMKFESDSCGVVTADVNVPRAGG